MADFFSRCQDVELYLKIHELRITSVEQKNPTLVVDVWIVEQVENPVQIRKTTRRTLGMASILVEAGFAHYNAVAASHPQIKVIEQYNFIITSLSVQ